MSPVGGTTIELVWRLTLMSSHSASTGARPAWLGGVLLAVLAASQLIIAVDYNIVYVALPSIGRELQFSESALQWVVSAYALTFGGFLLLGGRASDYLDRRTLFIVALGLYGASSLVGGLATDGAVLIIARMIQGLGGALLFPVTLTILNTQFEEGHQRNRALAVWAAVGAGGAALGALLGGVLTSALGWRWTFFVVVPLAVIVALVALWVLPRREKSSVTRRTLRDYDLPGSLTGTAASLLLVYALVQGPEVGWGSVTTIVSFVIAAALFAAFITIEAKVQRPLMPLRIFRSPNLRGGAMITGLHYAGFGGHFYLVTIWLQDAHRFNALQAGLAFIPLALAIVVGSSAGGKMTTRFGGRVTVITGFVFGIVGMIGLYFSLRADGSYLLGMMPWIILTGLGMGITWTAQWIVVATGIPEEEHGIASGVASTTQQVGSAVGLAILIAVMGAVTGTADSTAAINDGIRAAFLTVAGLLAVGVLVGAVILPAHQKTPQQTAVPAA